MKIERIKRRTASAQRIADQLPHDLVVVGETRWTFKQDLLAIRQLGLENRVRYLDFVPLDDLVCLYNQATCSVYPSLYESFGLAQLEAFACGCPVIAANSGGLREIAGDAALYCDPYDTDSIAAEILRMLSDFRLRESLIEKGLLRATEFTWHRFAQETVKLLSDVVSERSLRDAG